MTHRNDSYLRMNLFPFLSSFSSFFSFSCCHCRTHRPWVRFLFILKPQKSTKATLVHYVNRPAGLQSRQSQDAIENGQMSEAYHYFYLCYFLSFYFELGRKDFWNQFLKWLDLDYFHGYQSLSISLIPNNLIQESTDACFAQHKRITTPVK